MTKCPYVPPHPFMLDFPHLMLRHRVVEAKAEQVDFIAAPVGEMDRNGTMARIAAPVVNWAAKTGNKLTRAADGKVARHRPQSAAAQIPQPHLCVRDARRSR